MTSRRATRLLLLVACLLATPLGAPAQLVPEWETEIPVGTALSSGLAGSLTDAAGVTYVTGINGPSSNTDVLTAAIGADGTPLWSDVFNGPADWHDQARGLAFGPGDTLYVTGNTPSPTDVANVLLLRYERATGALLDVVQDASFVSEHGASVVADAAGNVTLTGGTTGDGGDALIQSYDDAGALRWETTYDGPAFGPFSQDTGLEVLLDGDGDVVVLVHGIMGSSQPDYVVAKYASRDGSLLWLTTWGSNGGDYASDMVLDAAGDVYVTGTAIDLIDKFSTIKLDGDDGSLVWQEYDAVGLDHVPAAIALDGAGGVYVSGRSDPDGNQSNFNDDFFTVKRDAATGALRWVHRYGSSCVGCFDVSNDVTADTQGRVYLTGSTSSPPYGADMILFVLDAATGTEITRGVVSGDGIESAGGGVVRLDAQENVYVTGGTSNADTGQGAIAVWRFAALDGGPWTDLGAGLAGTGGLVPSLAGSGPLTPGSRNVLALSDALPGASATLVVGLARIDAPFKGGVLVPRPDVLVPGVAGGAGTWSLSFTWPAGVPAGTAVFVQDWIVDPAGPVGFAASNAVEGVAP